MNLDDLRKAVEHHSGTFHCAKINNDAVTKDVEFHHEFEPPVAIEVDIPIKKLADFYQTFANLTLYRDPSSGDAAFYIGSPDEWGALESDFRLWLEGLDGDEEEELLPPWIGDRVVIGEIPASGNYLLVPLSGEKRGFVFEFEHDGFEFIECAPDIEQFVYQLLDPSPTALMGIASHMRFVDGDDSSSQWWICEMRDNRGKVVSTRS